MLGVIIACSLSIVLLSFLAWAYSQHKNKQADRILRKHGLLRVTPTEAPNDDHLFQ